MSARRSKPRGERPPAAARETPAAPPRPLSDAERAELAAYTERERQRPPAPRFNGADGKEVRPQAGEDLALFRARLARAVGSSDPTVINHLLAHATYATEGDAPIGEKCNTAAALLAGIGPRDEAEGMLAVQMVAAHNLALAIARRALKTERVDFLATYSNLTAKLMNVYARQLVTLARLRGQTGRQTVRVEHVTVQAGGQAVVGNVTPRGRGDGGES